MKSLLLITLGLLLTSCATHRYPAETHYPLPNKVPLHGGRVVLQLNIGERLEEPIGTYSGDNYGPRQPTTSQYRILDASSGKLLGTAESSITTNNFIGGLFYGERFIEASADSGSILITEDMSDASPVRRYILFTRTTEGTYKTQYLAPKSVIAPDVIEFGYILPTVHLTDPKFDDISRLSTPFSKG